MPPFVSPRPETSRYSRKAPPVTYEAFPEPVIRRQPTALPPAPRPRELSPPAVIEPVQPPVTQRTTPGTWREIIARFEAEPPAKPPETRAVPPAPLEPEESAAPDDVVAPAPADEEPGTPAGELPPFGYFPRDAPDKGVPWEVEAMTTPDYTAPRSIHDPEHDSWPVEAEAGDARPAWDDGRDRDIEPVADERDAGREEEFEDIGELILDDVVSEDDWEDELEPAEEATDATSDFPLDAFIVPAGTHHVPAGYDAEHVALLVAHRLDELAQQLRDGGLGALGSADSVDELSRVLAAIVTGYLARDA